MIALAVLVALIAPTPTGIILAVIAAALLALIVREVVEAPHITDRRYEIDLP